MEEYEKLKNLSDLPMYLLPFIEFMEGFDDGEKKNASLPHLENIKYLKALKKKINVSKKEYLQCYVILEKASIYMPYEDWIYLADLLIMELDQVLPFSNTQHSFIC